MCLIMLMKVVILIYKLKKQFAYTICDKPQYSHFSTGSPVASKFVLTCEND